MRLIYGTGNAAKLNWMREILSDLPVEIVGLAELDDCPELPTPPEDGKNPLENAVSKATAYYRALGRPVFSCDSGLYLEGLPEHLQPGVYVRRVEGKILSDEEMTAYYSALASRFGMLRAQYRNGICLVTGEWRVEQSMDESLWSVPFGITAKPHPQRTLGFPLDCLSVELKSGKYYMDLPKGYTGDILQEQGFRDFFHKALQL